MTLKFDNYPTDVAAIVKSALQAADPDTAVRRYLWLEGTNLCVGDFRHDLQQGNVYLISVGKGAVPMARAAIEILGESLKQALIVTKHAGPNTEFSAAGAVEITVIEAGHPLPNDESVRAARMASEMLAVTQHNDLVLFLISGGTSALLADPMVPLADWQALTNALLESGCTINDLNLVRRNLDRIKGGGLARMAAPAACVSLILSDVVNNPLLDIGSGPTVLVQETPKAAAKILKRYAVDAKLSQATDKRIEQALLRDAAEPTIPPDIVRHFVVGDVRQAAKAAMIRAAQRGFLSQILTVRLQGEAKETGRFAAAVAKDLPPGRCLIMGGETTVTVTGGGTGGRNQEMALSAAIDLAQWPETVIACFATDGEDGATQAAGAVVTGATISQSRQLNLDPHYYLSDNDSHTFFAQLDAAAPAEQQTDIVPEHLITTGPTGTNVNDLLVILTYPPTKPEPGNETLSVETSSAQQRITKE